MKRKPKKQSEMQILRECLDEKGIGWIDWTDKRIKRTLFRYQKEFVSVVCGKCTEGGEKGLLEIKTDLLGDDPIGYLTAEDVMGKLFRGSENG